MLKIDRTTSIHSREKIARICVEIDLAKKLVPRISVLGSELNIEYEGLHQICFACGKYGHRLDSCYENLGGQMPSQPANPGGGETTGRGATVDGEEDQNGNNNPGINAQEPSVKDSLDFGPWMLVKKPIRRKKDISFPKKKGAHYDYDSNSNIERETNQEAIYLEAGSRFNALYEEGNLSHENPNGKKENGLKENGPLFVKAQGGLDKEQALRKRSLKVNNSKNQASHKNGPNAKIGVTRNEKSILPKVQNQGKQVAIHDEAIEAPSPQGSKCRDPEVEAMELVMLESMRCLQQEQTEAYLAMKEPGKSIDRNLVRTDLPKCRMTESSTPSGVMMEQTTISQPSKPPDGQVIILPTVKNKEGSLSRNRIGLKQKANSQRCFPVTGSQLP
ncbi:uncharacterized protein LOC110264826 [Arachis ipaensis]|uniref:uncharacterized protein LOC110264826 n=1 Tax=Arachis ipaensis TaxID=130454 RepID=UPI000A2B8842|nr:uncharacterized protein LOC110264826 [Arachis ipaensis]